jgi:hypothetical protein
MKKKETKIEDNAFLRGPNKKVSLTFSFQLLGWKLQIVKLNFFWWEYKKSIPFPILVPELKRV